MNMVMLKHRFVYVQDVMGDRVVVNKEEKDNHGDDWVYFDIKLDTSFDMLDFFHAGIQCAKNQHIVTGKQIGRAHV